MSKPKLKDQVRLKLDDALRYCKKVYNKHWTFLPDQLSISKF